MYKRKAKKFKVLKFFKERHITHYLLIYQWYTQPNDTDNLTPTPYHVSNLCEEHFIYSVEGYQRSAWYDDGKGKIYYDFREIIISLALPWLPYFYTQSS